MYNLFFYILKIYKNIRHKNCGFSQQWVGGGILQVKHAYMYMYIYIYIYIYITDYIRIYLNEYTHTHALTYIYIDASFITMSQVTSVVRCLTPFYLALIFAAEEQ